MKTFTEWLNESHPDPTRDYGDEGRMFTAAGHPTTGRLEDWLEKNADYVRVERGYGSCTDCVRVFLDPRAEDESRRTGEGLDLWGLWHLEDYGVTSRVSGNSVILMPLDDEGLVRRNEGVFNEEDDQTRSFLNWLRELEKKFPIEGYNDRSEDRHNLLIGRIFSLLDELGETKDFHNYISTASESVLWSNYYRLLDRYVQLVHPEMLEMWREEDFGNTNQRRH